MCSAQWLHIHYIMSDEGEVLLGGKNHGDSEQVGRAELHSALLMCRIRVNTGAQERLEGQAGVGGTGQRSLTLLEAVQTYQKFQKEGTRLAMASSLAHPFSVLSPWSIPASFKDHPSFADS